MRLKSAPLGGGNPSTGKLYSVALEPNGSPGPLRQLWQSGPADAPDGFAVAKSGNVYLALVGASNQIVELSPTGHEITRFGQQYTGTNNSSVPYDSPSGIQWLGTELVIANQSYTTGNAADQALLGLQVGETGQPTFISKYAGLRPGERLPVHRKHRRRRRTRHARRK